MANKVIVSCAECGYPLAAEAAGQVVTCPMCGTVNESISGVDIPNPIFWGGIGLLAGFLIARSKWVGQQMGRIKSRFDD